MAVLWWGVGSILVFYILILCVGLWASRRTRRSAGEGGLTQEDMMLAGRNVGLLIGCFTMTATWVDGGYINGTAEEVFTRGLVWCQAPFGYALSLIIGGIFFAGPMRTSGYVTMVDAFQRKYGERIGGLMFIPAAMGETFWTAAVLAALGSTLTVILEIDFSISVICSAAFAAVYCGVGGAWSIAYTDCVQLTCLFVGLWTCVPFVLSNPAVDPIFPNFHRWSGSVKKADIGLYIDLGLQLIFGGIAWQSYFQRVLSAKSARNARMLSVFAGFACFMMAIPSVLMGGAAAVTNWGNVTGFGKTTIEKSVMTLPTTLRYLTPLPVAVIGMGAICAAVMSSTDASVFSAASMFSRNVYKMILRPRASEREIIWVLRASVIIVAALSTLLAIFIGSIYALWILCSDLVYVILFPELTCVLFYRRSNGYGAVAGFVVGLVLRLTGGEPLIGLPTLVNYPLFEHASSEYPLGRQLFPFKTIAMLCCYASIFIVSEATYWTFWKWPQLARKIDVLDVVEQHRQLFEDREFGSSSTTTDNVRGGGLAGTPETSVYNRKTKSNPNNNVLYELRSTANFAEASLADNAANGLSHHRRRQSLPWIDDDAASSKYSAVTESQKRPVVGGDVTTALPDAGDKMADHQSRIVSSNIRKNVL